MKDRMRNVAVGLTVLTALVMLGVLIVLFAGLPSIFQRGQTIYVKMESSAGVRKGDSVHIADIRVGRITDISFTDPAVPIKGVTITARIDEDVYISPNSVLVAYKGMMGLSYVSLEPGELHGIEPMPLPPSIERPPGPLILQGVVVEPSMLGALEPAVKKMVGVVERIDLLAQRLIDTTDRLSKLITSLHNTASRIENGDGSLGKLIADPELYEELVSAVKQMNYMAAQFSALAQRWAADGIELKME